MNKTIAINRLENLATMIKETGLTVEMLDPRCDRVPYFGFAVFSNENENRIDIYLNDENSLFWQWMDINENEAPMFTEPLPQISFAAPQVFVDVVKRLINDVK